MKRTIVPLLGLSVLAACIDATPPTSPLRSAALTPQLAVAARENVVLPLDQTFFNSCAGEQVQVTGELHLVTMTNQKPNGEIADVFHTNFRNAVGVGLTSGQAYRATSAENTAFQGVPPGPPGGPWRSVHQGSLHLVATGGGPSFMWHFVFVVTKEPGSPPDIVVFHSEVRCP